MAKGAKQVAAALAALASDAFDAAQEERQAREFAETLVRFGPAAIAASTLLMLCVNLYAAARSTQLSHRLQRPWPDLPTSLRLPWPLGVLAFGCAALRLRPARLRRRNISRSASAGSAQRSPCRALPSPTPCRAASSCGP